MGICACHGVHVEVKGQSVSTGSLPSSMQVPETELRSLGMGTGVNLMSHPPGFSMTLNSAKLYVLVYLQRQALGITLYRKMDLDSCTNVFVCYEGLFKL